MGITDHPWHLGEHMDSLHEVQDKHVVLGEVLVGYCGSRLIAQVACVLGPPRN